MMMIMMTVMLVITIMMIYVIHVIYKGMSSRIRSGMSLGINNEDLMMMMI